MSRVSSPTTSRAARVGRVVAALAAAAGLVAVNALGMTAAASAATAGRAAGPTHPIAATASAAQALAVPAAGTRPPVMIVLDASGSMNAQDAPGSRIDAAKKAVTGLINQMPADVKVGLQVFGSRTGNGDADKAAGCQDIVTLAKVGTLNKAALTGEVADIKASGYTPIARALQQAAKALPSEGPRSIVLVSDGEETCAPPEPCDVAKQLKEQGIDLTVHTIGFKVDDTARGQLSCIAAATGGSYADADNAAQLEQTLDAGFQRAAEKYSPKGTPVNGTPKPAANSPVLVPVSIWTTWWTARRSTERRPSTTECR
ncbi:MAG: vWA domain-containing protein [Nakamurella sp.]